MHTYYVHIDIYTFSSYNYVWLLSQSSFALLSVASNSCSAACDKVCIALQVSLLTFRHFTLIRSYYFLYLADEIQMVGQEVSFFVLVLLFLFFPQGCSRSWCRAENHGHTNHAQERGSPQTWLLHFSSGWKQRRFAASLRKVLQRHPFAAVCVRERKVIKAFKVSAQKASLLVTTL